MDINRCPICNSIIYQTEDDLGDLKAELTIDLNLDLSEFSFLNSEDEKREFLQYFLFRIEETLWDDDPVKTPNGFSVWKEGIEVPYEWQTWEGLTSLQYHHWNAIRDYVQLQQELNISSFYYYDIPEIIPNQTLYEKNHLLTLHSIIEEILRVKEVDKDYLFNSSKYHEWSPMWEQYEWNDLGRLLSSQKQLIRGIHMEDLRHPIINTGWRDIFTYADEEYSDMDFSVNILNLLDESDEKRITSTIDDWRHSNIELGTYCSTSDYDNTITFAIIEAKELTNFLMSTSENEPQGIVEFNTKAYKVNDYVDSAFSRTFIKYDDNNFRILNDDNEPNIDINDNMLFYAMVHLRMTNESTEEESLNQHRIVFKMESNGVEMQFIARSDFEEGHEPTYYVNNTLWEHTEENYDTFLSNHGWERENIYSVTKHIPMADIWFMERENWFIYFDGEVIKNQYSFFCNIWDPKWVENFQLSFDSYCEETLTNVEFEGTIFELGFISKAQLQSIIENGGGRNGGGNWNLPNGGPLSEIFTGMVTLCLEKRRKTAHLTSADGIGGVDCCGLRVLRAYKNLCDQLFQTGAYRTLHRDHIAYRVHVEGCGGCGGLIGGQVALWHAVCEPIDPEWQTVWCKTMTTEEFGTDYDPLPQLPYSKIWEYRYTIEYEGCDKWDTRGWI